MTDPVPPPEQPRDCVRCGLPVEAAIHWPGMVADAHPFEEADDDR